MWKHSVFIKHSYEPQWKHWGYFDTKTAARAEAARMRQFCRTPCDAFKAKVVPVDIDKADFSAMAAAMGEPC